MRILFSFLLKSQRATAAAEMALVTPLLITLMFGAFELGNYFLSEHVVVKAVRDGARYAGRLGFTNYPCSSESTDNIPLGTVVSDTRNLVRTGQITGGTARLVGWTDPATIVVTYDCIDPTDATPSYTGIYNGMDYVPVVTVKTSATDPRLTYSSLFNNLGFSSTSLSLNAEAQSAVMGI